MVWREISGTRLDQFEFNPARGSAGGIIVRWNSAVVTGKVLSVGEFSLAVEFYSMHVNVKWRCVSVYGPVMRSRKKTFWEELRTVCGEADEPKVICGDFNAIFALKDKVMGTLCLENIRSANAFLQDLAFWEPPV